MKSKHLLIMMLFSVLLFVSWKAIDQEWLTEKRKGYVLMYTSSDKKNSKEYQKLVEKGMTSVQRFFTSVRSLLFLFIRTDSHWKAPGKKSGICLTLNQNVGWWQAV